MKYKSNLIKRVFFLGIISSMIQTIIYGLILSLIYFVLSATKESHWTDFIYEITFIATFFYFSILISLANIIEAIINNRLYKIFITIITLLLYGLLWVEDIEGCPGLSIIILMGGILVILMKHVIYRSLKKWVSID